MYEKPLSALHSYMTDLGRENLRTYDISVILLKHGELLLAKLDAMRPFIAPDSQFTKLLNDKGIASFLQQYDSNPRQAGKLSDSHAKNFRDIMEPLKAACQVADYLASFVKTTKEHLENLEKRSMELDLRWNNVFTMHIIDLFNLINKIALFVYQFPTIRYIAILCDCFDRIKKTVNFECKPEYIRQIIGYMVSSPFDTVRAAIGDLQRKLSQLITQVGPILVKIFGIWTGIDWQMFAIFNRPERTVESTLPPTESICLSYLEKIHQLCYFFFMAYPDVITAFPQFQALICSTFSDCPNIMITRAVMMTFDQIMEIQQKSQNKLDVNINFIKTEMEVKKRSSHKQRVFYISSLLRDIIDVAQFDSQLLPQLVYDVLPLAGFANHELRTLLQFSDTPFPEATQLLAHLVDLAHLFNKYQKTIGRFMLFNLGSVDSNYLNQMISTFNTAPSNWQQSLNNSMIDLSNQLVELDLEAYDNNDRYDIYPLILTAGRVLYYFNHVKTLQRAAFLNPVFEHFTVIVLHANLMQHPLDTLLHFCPIQTYWSYAPTIFNYAQNGVGGIHLYSRIISLFAQFNRDQISLSSATQTLATLATCLNAVRQEVLGRIQNSIRRYLDKSSPIVSIIQQNRFDHLFSWEQYNSYKLDTSLEMSDPLFREDIWQLKEFMMKVPGVINFNGEDVLLSEFYATEITRSLAQVLFRDQVADPQWLDETFAAATQFIWPLYSLLNVSFSRKLMETRFENSTYDNQITFLQQISMIRAEVDAIGNQYLQRELADKNGIDNTKLVAIFQERFIKFITQDYNQTIYRPYGKCFTNSNRDAKIDYQAEQFFSTTSFMHMFNNLGPQCGFLLDRTLIVEIIKTMLKIYEGFERMNNELIQWYQDYNHNGSLWCSEQVRAKIEPYATELVRLGIILVIRSLVREALSAVCAKTVPGLKSLVESALIRSPERLTQKEDLINEMMGDGPNYHFIELALSQKTVRPTSDPNLLFFFLGILLNSPQYDSAKYYPDNEIISNNIHVIPTAIDAFCQMFRVFTTSYDANSLTTGLKFFFGVLQHIVQFKIKNKEICQQSNVNAFIVLADMFPRYLTNCEYGKISQSFPFSIISEAYRDVDSHARKRKHNKHRLDSQSVASVDLSATPPTSKSSDRESKKDSKRDRAKTTRSKK